MIDADELLAAIDREVWSRLELNSTDKNEYGTGFDCCGCATYSEIIEAIEEIVKRMKP